MKLRLSTIASASKAVSRNENCVFQLFNKLADTHKAINLVKIFIYVGRWHSIRQPAYIRIGCSEKI
jgi:hypothetical protein